MDTDIYICSKPLQYFNVRNIGYGNASSKKLLINLGHFRDAEQFLHQKKKILLFMEGFLSYPDLYECICLKKDSEATEEIVLIIQKA